MSPSCCKIEHSYAAKVDEEILPVRVTCSSPRKPNCLSLYSKMLMEVDILAKHKLFSFATCVHHLYVCFLRSLCASQAV